jgi:murein DD-endopeptidase MepM/ murein hydrolase activator NlpD
MTNMRGAFFVLFFLLLSACSKSGEYFGLMGSNPTTTTTTTTTAPGASSSTTTTVTTTTTTTTVPPVEVAVTAVALSNLAGVVAIGGEVIFTVTVDQALTVDNGSGNPGYTLSNGGIADCPQASATTFTCTYTVSDGDTNGAVNLATGGFSARDAILTVSGVSANVASLDPASGNNAFNSTAIAIDGGTYNNTYEVGVWPTSNTTTPELLEDTYGPRLLSGVYDFHRGLDIETGVGGPPIPIRAIMDGTITRIEPYPYAGLERFGNFVCIKHTFLGPFDRNQTTYVHLDSFQGGLSEGDTVSAGDIIGYMGSTGDNINTVHLHFENYAHDTDYRINNGSIIRVNSRNPLRFLPHKEYHPTITAEKSGTDLVVNVSQNPASMTIVSLDIIPNGMATVNVDFEGRTHMDPGNDDTNPYNNVEVTVQNFNSGISAYQYSITLSGADYSGISSATIEAVNVRGNTYRFPISF